LLSAHLGERLAARQNAQSNHQSNSAGSCSHFCLLSEICSPVPRDYEQQSRQHSNFENKPMQTKTDQIFT
jgi:hypothetical protein